MNVLQCLKHSKDYILEEYGAYDDDVSAIKYCMICCEAIRGPAYCYNDSCIHKSCAESPGKIQHPLHIHPLRIRDRDTLDYFICDGCHTLSPTFKYFCKKCDVKLDFQCVSKHVEGQALKERVQKVTDYHPHKLQLSYFPFETLQALGGNAPCCCCLKDIKDSAYVCLSDDCALLCHGSCLDTIPKQVKSSFHPQHSLLPRHIKEYKECHACRKEVRAIELRCPICKYSFHVSCGKHSTPGLRLQDHEHTLFYIDYWDGSGSNCDICYQLCEGPIYRCIERGINFHVECLVPPVVNHECHDHQLTLTSSVVPKGSASKYRCDVCEEEEDFEHYVYHCEECYFMAHIECLFSEEDSPPLVDSEQQIDEVPEAETEDDQGAEESEKSSDEEIDEAEIDNEQESDLEDCSLPKLNKKIRYVTARIDELTIKLNLLQKMHAKKLASQS